MTLISFVVAVSKNNMIGRDGGLPWHISSDLKRFKEITMGKPVIMGRKTFVSIGRPLDGRQNIVVTRDRSFAVEGVEVAHSLAEALTRGRASAEASGADEVAVIGGAEIYAAALPLAERIYLTEIEAAPEGDARFPDLDPAEWRELSRTAQPRGPKDDHDWSLVVLERRRRP